MTLYIDSSTLLKIYLNQPEGPTAADLARTDEGWISGWHTYVEVRRNLTRVFAGDNLRAARTQFARDWGRFHAVELGADTCETAAQLAELTGVQSLDALHLGAAASVGGGDLPFLTYDRRQADAARSLGWTVLGA
ncbi:MAG TPA: type II toxin-antitoxin system VapC family toxin [Actinomycetota bacterium]